jgi:MOSC domain-containing protein YiiM
VRDAAPDPRASRAEAAFAAALASILELPVEEVPAPEPGVDFADGWRRWLGGRGLGLVPIAGAAGFSWPGPWIARVRPPGGEPPRALVMYGVPSGVAWDPTGASAEPGWTIEDGFVLAALDVALALPPRAQAPREAGVVEGIFIAPSAGAAAQVCTSAQTLPGRGLAGDRHASGSGTFPSGVAGSALTLIAAEVLESFAPPLSADEHRRNVVTRGIDVNALVEQDFAIGRVRCRGMRLCEPCTVLDGYSERALLRPLVHRGGLRADILSEGTIALGDAVRAL